jgi:hypothetical protein
VAEKRLEVVLWDGSYVQPDLCNKNDHYTGPFKIYPTRHGVGCPGHHDMVREYYGRVWETHAGLLNDPKLEWGFYREDVLDVNPKYL